MKEKCFHHLMVMVFICWIIILSACSSEPSQSHTHVYDPITLMCYTPGCYDVDSSAIAFIKDSNGNIARFRSLQDAVDYITDPATYYSNHGGSSHTGLVSSREVLLMKNASGGGVVIDGTDVTLNMQNYSYSFSDQQGIVVSGSSNVVVKGDASLSVTSSATVENIFSVKDGSLTTAVSFSGSIALGTKASMTIQGTETTCVSISGFSAEGEHSSILLNSGNVILSDTSVYQKIASSIDPSSSVSLSIDGHIHQMEEGQTVLPTCTTDGFTLQVCSGCGYSFASNTVLAFGHSWNAGVVIAEPTDSTEGARLHTCDVCGAEVEREIAKVDSSGSGFEPIEAPDKRIHAKMQVIPYPNQDGEVLVVLSNSNLNAECSSAEYRWYVDFVLVQTDSELGLSTSSYTYQIPDGGIHTIMCTYWNAFGGGSIAVEVSL